MTSLSQPQEDLNQAKVQEQLVTLENTIKRFDEAITLLQSQEQPRLKNPELWLLVKCAINRRDHYQQELNDYKATIERATRTPQLYRRFLDGIHQMIDEINHSIEVFENPCRRLSEGQDSLGNEILILEVEVENPISIDSIEDILEIHDDSEENV